MAMIQPNKHGKVKQAQKQLKGYLQRINQNWDSATNAQRLTLTKAVLVAMIRIQLHQLGRVEDVE